ncbi:MFS transporter [Tsukamurella soli]|uniref:MFS transporter n=1 Tax=Tsukamurella soli TaxID=644556 RepID=A0ABP8JVG3_9ACTN
MTAATPVAEPSTARRWVMLLVSMTAAITTTAAVNGAAFLIPQLHHRGVPLQHAGLFAAAGPLGVLLTTIAWGALIDRVGERRVLLVSLTGAVFGLGATVALFAVDAPLWTTALGLLVSSAMAASCNGASGRIVVGWFPPQRRGTAMGIRQTSQPLGIGILSLLMPVLAQRVSLAAATAVPLVIACLSLVLVAVFIVDPPLPAPSAGPGSSPAAPPNPYRTSRFLYRIHSSSVLLQLPQTAIWTYGITWLIVGLHWAPATAGLVVTASQVCGAAGRVASGALSDRVGSRTAPIRWIAVCAAVTVGGLACLAGTGSGWAVVVFLLASTATVADNGLAFTAVAERAGPFYSGRALAIQNTGQFMLSTAAAPLLGILIGAAGFGTAFGVVALAPLLALPVIPSDRR